MADTLAYPNLVTYDRTGIDLQSISATRTPTFTFHSLHQDSCASQPDLPPIILLDCHNPFATCLHIKDWLLKKHEDSAYSAPGILRMDHQELDQMDRKKQGWMILGPNAATLDETGWARKDNKGTSLSVGIIAVLVKSDPRIRWFYTLFPVSSLLGHLNEVDSNLLAPRVILESQHSSYKYARMRAFIQEEFTAAIRMPDSPDWINAQKLSDFCPSILDPDNAVSRLEEDSWLYWNTPKPEESLFPNRGTVNNTATTKVPLAKDKTNKERNQQDRSVATLDFLEPTNDRYAHHLHPAERELASLARLKCAEYLFIKRNFFHAFWTEIYRSDKLLDIAAAPSTSNPATSRRLDPTGQIVRQDTPFSASAASTPAPSSRFDSSAPTTISAATPARGRGAGYDASRRNRVRTERAHQVWLEQEYKVRNAAARTLVIGWRILGFLEESRYVPWVKEGWGGEVEDE